MPLYHFHVQSAIEAYDAEGIELPNLEAAKASAVTSVRALIVEEIRHEHRFSPNHSIRIANADGLSLHVTRYGDCVDVRL